MTFTHTPVLLAEVLGLLAVPGVRRLIDGTVGGGGHAAALLEALPECELLGLDRDDAALAAAAQRLAPFGARVRLERGRFGGLAAAAAAAGWEQVDAVLLDVGVSSHQLDTPERGFAHRLDGPLDMRMDRRAPLTAAVLLNRSEEQELERIFREFGEEPCARRLARAVVARRAERPWERTQELARLVTATLGRTHERGLPAATRCFQALRIAVNEELEELAQGLAAGIGLLRPGGRIAVISFHSLEDRLVKQRFRFEATACLCPPKLPVCRCGHRPRLRLLTRHPLRPGEAELAVNPRAAPARLRAAERLAEKAA
jgi:16S rRNA (cytosine1402-N4)-methyltransferase